MNEENETNSAAMKLFQINFLANSKVFQCTNPTCGKSYTTKAGLRYHQKNSTKTTCNPNVAAAMAQVYIFIFLYYILFILLNASLLPSFFLFHKNCQIPFFQYLN